MTTQSHPSASSSSATTPDAERADGINRRRVLGGAAVAVAGAAALAACGSSDNSSSSEGTTGASMTNTSSGALTDTASVPVGGGVIIEAEKVVVTQPTAGNFKAFSAICTHKGCTVSDVTDGEIICPCHGSKYSITDGSVINGPATKPLPEEQIMVHDGQVMPA